MRQTTTSNSSQYWIWKHPIKLLRYLEKNHLRQDREYVKSLIYNDYPDEGVMLIQNYDLTVDEKWDLITDFLIDQPQITSAGYGDQRMGKDGTITTIFEKVIERCRIRGIRIPRFVTLGNIKAPPFVKTGGYAHPLDWLEGKEQPNDMYFSFLNIPPGTAEQEVWIYCSEIETVLPAREGLAMENRLFSQLAGTLAQNHQKLFGLCKLASRVDINFIRDCNFKFFKFISPEKLAVEGIERDGVLSGLGQLLLPKSKDDKSSVLFSFDNQLIQLDHDLPEWWSSEYSEMYRDIDMAKVWEYIEVQFYNNMDLNSIRIACSQKFRKQLSMKELADHFGKGTTETKIKV